MLIIRIDDLTPITLKTKNKACTDDIMIVPTTANIAKENLRKIINLTGSLEIIADSSMNVVDMYYVLDGLDGLTGLERINDPTETVSPLHSIAFSAKFSRPPWFDTGNLTSMRSMFKFCSGFVEMPFYDTRNVTDMSYMFSSCSGLTTVPQFDTSKVTDMSNMFRACYGLTTVPQFDTSKVTDMSDMFCWCTNLTTVPQFDTSSVTTMQGMFYCCYALTTVPQFDTRNVTNMYGMFSDCFRLTTVAQIDLRNVRDKNELFVRCYNLTTVLIKNIRGYLPLYDSELLTMDSLLNLLNETIYSTTSHGQLTLGTANLAKFTGDYEYVKKTGVYLDLDDNEVTELTNDQTKIPVVWCSAEDEGAMTIADYMSEKGWTLA